MEFVAKLGLVLLGFILFTVISIVRDELKLGALPHVALIAAVLYSISYLWKKATPPKKLTDRSEIGKNGFTEMMWACEAGDEELVRKLIASGSNINETDKNGATALIYAASYGKKNCVTALLEHGAEINSITKQGGTAQKFAEQKGHLEIAKILRDWGKG